MRHRRRGDADPRRSTTTSSASGRSRSAPGGVPRPRPRQGRRAGTTGSSTSARSPSRRRERADVTEPADGRIPLSRPYLGEREEELVLEVLRSGRLSLGPHIDRFEEHLAERVGAPFAAAVSSGTTGLHLLAHVAGIRPGRRGHHVAVLVRRDRQLLHLRGRRAGLRRRGRADAEPRPGGRRGRDHRAHPGDRRGRHVRLPVRARPDPRAVRAARARADPRLLRGARRRVQGRRRSAGTARRRSSPSTRTSRSRRARAASSRRTPRSSGSC